MYTDINGQTYKLKHNKAIIQPNSTSSKIEIFSKINVDNEIYKLKFPECCSFLFDSNNNLEEFILHKLILSKNVRDCDCMFANCTKLKSVSIKHFNTSNVRSMRGMFKNCSELESLDLSSFDTLNVLSMGSMFKNCVKLTQLDLSSFDTSNISRINKFIKNSGIKQIDLSNLYLNDIDEICEIADVGIIKLYNSNNCKFINETLTSIHDINCNNSYNFR